MIINDVLLKHYIWKCIFYCLHMHKTWSDRLLAEEAVQDTFRIACAKADKLLFSPNPKGWLLNTLKNVTKNKVRSQVYLRNILELDENMIPGNSDVLDIDFMYSDLTNSEDYKLLKKIALDKYSMLEAAKEMGISVEACKKRVQRAKKKLKKSFEKMV